MTSLVQGVTTVRDGDSSGDDVEDDSSLRAFTAELDEITRALDEDARQFRGRLGAGATTDSLRRSRVGGGGSYHTPPTASSRGSGGIMHRLNATTKSPQPSVYSATPKAASTTVEGSMASHRLARRRDDNDDDGVPTPMQTPAPLMFTPLVDSERRYYYARGEGDNNNNNNEAKVSWEDTLLNSIAGRNSSAPPISATRTANTRTGPATSTYAKSSPLIDESQKLIVDKVRDVLERQDDRIRSLQGENDRLRARVRDLEAELGNLDLQHRHPSPLAAPAPDPYYASPPPSLPPQHDPYLPPSHVHYGATPPRGPASSGRRVSVAPMSSPGSRFVADLVRHIDIDPVYHTALSLIMDDHFARTAQLRRQQHEWDNY